jgi:hypothetical protein
MRSGVKLLLSLAVLITVAMLVPSSGLGQDAAVEDVVYLKNGSIIRGMIIEQIPGENLKIRTKDGSLFVFDMADIERIAKEEVKGEVTPKAEEETASATEVKQPIGTKKQPGLAFALSLFLPGGGQFYNGESGKGAAMLGAAMGGMLMFIVFFEEESLSWGNRSDSGDNQTLSLMGLFIATAAIIWSWIDAPISAARINRENGWTIIPGEEQNLCLNVTDLRVDGQTTPGLALTWSF